MLLFGLFLIVQWFLCSAYCGGLWLASLRVMQEIANVLGIPDEAAKYVNILKKGKKAYHALLWNGNLSNLVSKSFFSVHSVDEGAMAAGL